MKRKNDIDILHIDDRIIVINKAADTLTIPDRYNKTLPNLFDILSAEYEKVFVVHRLDKGTSGIVLFARDAEAHKLLNTQFQEKEVLKIYHAVVAGIIRDKELEIDIPLMENPSKPGATIPSARGKESLTLLRVLENFRSSTLIECKLVTGRHHQLRAHVAAIGHPLLVDPLYGSNEAFFLSSLKRKYNLKKNEEEHPIISRITMHARKIGFTHPNGEYVEYEAQYPKDFKALIQTLSKYSSL